jgi:5-methylcytosine-specific restriction enzyme subunit McrC
MLEYAYRLEHKRFFFLEGLIDCQSLAEFYERLANILALRVLDRSRKGFYRAYLAESDQLAYVRGRLDVPQMLRSPGQVRPYCHFEEHTADIEDNQLLAWTLGRIARSGTCTEGVLPTVRRAYRVLQGVVTPTPFEAQACVGRPYHRLNDDYQPLHALCRFFLDQSGPSHTLGDRAMLPFLVDMAYLYEMFVAEWLLKHLPIGLALKVQEKVKVGHRNAWTFDVDLVLYDQATNGAICVLDTKYKTPDKPSNEDISQVVTYAKLKECQNAVLIYPTPLALPLDAWFGDVRVHSMTFSLGGNLEQAGQRFLQQLISSVAH